MPLSIKKHIKGTGVQNETDRTKEMTIEVSDSASSSTSTTLQTKQTVNRTLDLPDASGELVEKDFAQTLTNKTIDGDDNTLQDIDLPSLKTQLADASKFIVRDASGAVVSDKDTPAGDVVGTTDTQTLENKTIDGTSATGNNTVTADASNITYDNTTSGLTATTSQAALDEVEGRVDTLEADKLDGPGTHADNLLIKTDGVDTNNSQVTGISIDDLNNMTGLNDLTVGGDLTVSGTTTSVNSTNLEVTDANITVNNNGNDVSAEGAGLTVERAGTDGSLVYEDALASKFKAGALGSEMELANVSSTQSLTNKSLADASNDLTNASADSFTRASGNQQVVTIPDTATPDNLVLEAQAQVLTNKDFDGGTATDASRLTVPKDTLANLLLLTRKEGTIVYATDTDRFYSDDGTTLREIGSGAGNINFIDEPDAETPITQWDTYNDVGSGTQPIDGTGGIATGVGFVVSSTDPLSGQASFQFIKDGVNRQGNGASIDFAIDDAYKAKVLNISFDYLVESGAFNAGSRTTDSDLVVYIYDVDNSQLIQPSNFKLLSNSTQIADQFSGTFQTSATSNNYRLILHVASSGTDAFTLKIDNVAVSPSDYVFGTPITDWQEFTPTPGNLTTNAGYIGRYRRVGDSIEMQQEIEFTGTTNAASVTFNMPAGLVVDEAKMTFTGGGNVHVGFAQVLNAGITSYPAVVRYLGSNTFDLIQGFDNVANATNFLAAVQLTSTNIFTFSTGDKVTVNMQVPVQGWSSSVQVSDGFSQRDVSVKTAVSSNSLASSGAFSDLTISGIDFDTVGMSSGNSFIVQSSGKHEVIMTAFIGAAASGVFVGTVSINGVDQPEFLRARYISDSGLTLNGQSTYDLNAGDIIVFRGLQNTSVNQNISIVGEIKKRSGEPVVSATETVHFETFNTSGLVIPNTVVTTVTGWTETEDTHSAFSTSTGAFTAPISGVYQFDAQIFYTTTAGFNGFANFFIRDASGAQLKIFDLGGKSFFTGFGFQSIRGSISIKMNAGDTCSIETFQNSGSSQTLASTSTNLNYFTGVKVG